MNKSKKIKSLKREVKALKAIVAQLSVQHDFTDPAQRADAEEHSWSEEPTLGELEAELAEPMPTEDHPIYTNDDARVNSGF